MIRKTLIRIRTPLAVVLMVWAVLVAGGCAPTYTDYSAFVRAPMPVAATEVYRLAPPDSIHIQSQRVREIDGQHQQLAPDGSLHLPLLGRVMAADKTVEQLSRELETLAEQYYEDADITVNVAQYRSKKIFVFGEVGRPGPYPFDGGNTLLKTLAVAQPSRLADPSKIQVLRPSADGDVRRRMTVDLNEMVKRGDTTLDAILEEGDILYVPANPLASVGLALQQVLLPIQPLSQTIQAPADVYTPTQRTPYQSSNDGGF
jgi:polysaccharide export outer membrane protein